MVSGDIGDHWYSYLASDFVVLVLSKAVLSPPRRTVLVLDGCSNRGDSDRGSRRFAVTCGPMGRIAILDLVEYEKLIGQRIDSSKIEKVIGRWTAHDRHQALFLSFSETIGKRTT